MKKLIRYRVSISERFLASHPKAGKETGFVSKIYNLLDHGSLFVSLDESPATKRHTIRGNYQLWKRRFEKIERGEAVLELYSWTGKPFRSKCETIKVLDKDSGIGMQKLEFPHKELREPVSINEWYGDKENYTIDELARNDGLALQDFKDWFKGADLTEPLAIIHFTSFRY